MDDTLPQDGRPKVEGVGTSASVERELTESELATNYLNHQVADANRRLGQKEASYKFNQNYQPTAVIIPSWAEPGGMDYSDFNTEKLAGEQWDDWERDETLARLEDEMEALQDEIDGLFALRDTVKGGDTQVTTTYAAKERTRLAELEARKAKLKAVGYGDDAISKLV